MMLPSSPTQAFPNPVEQLPEFSEEDLIASICRESFYDFLQEFWEVVIKEKPIWNWHIEYLCDELQKLAEDVFLGKPRKYDVIINVPPGSTKSSICTVMFPAWVWTRMPSAKFICASYAYSLAMDLSRLSRDIIKSEKREDGRPGYRECFPDVLMREDQDSKGYFVNTKGGWRYSIGVDGAVTGKHAHFIIVDDPIDPNKAVSEIELATANRWMDETLPSRKVDKAVTPTILIMQRLHQNDPTGSRLEKESPVRHICIPAELSDNVSPPELRIQYDDGLMDPIRLNREVLHDQLIALGRYGFSGQYDQNPVPRGGAMFEVDRLKFHDAPPRAFKRVVRYWDKAGSHKKGAYTVGAKLALDYKGEWWILDIVRGQWDASRRERKIKEAAISDGKGVIVGVEQEPGSGGKESAENTARNLAGWRIHINKVGASDGDKVARADPFSSQVNAGNVNIIKAVWNRAFLDEIKHFPMSKYKDQVDACSGAFNLLAKARIVVGGMGCKERTGLAR